MTKELSKPQLDRIEIGLKGLTSIVEKGFAAIAEDFVSVNDRFDDINGRFDTVDEELCNIRTEIADIRERLERLEGDIKNIKGYSIEIDNLFARVKKIEQRLGITSIK